MKLPSRTTALRFAWGVAALPGLAQLYLLLAAVCSRFAYPYDLEWMEGGMLHHAARIAEGQGIYGPPSVDFIPYLYTPLYPGIVAALEPIFGISYQTARAISLLSLLGAIALAVIAVARFVDPAHRRAGVAGGLVGVGFFAATYPWVDGWYDIARGDTLFLAMILGGIVALLAWARADTGWKGHARIGVAAALLGLSFFCKQTGVLYVAAGGAIILVLNWRRVPVYVGVAGLVGLGGTAIINAATDGWFWTYVFEVHQAHDCNADRFWKSFDLMLWKFPAMTCVIALGLVCVGATWAIRRERPKSCGPLFAWSWMFAVSCVVGAVGWATQWAHFNAYIPAMLTGGIAAGAAVPALAGCLEAFPSVPRNAVSAATLATTLVLGAQLIDAWWQPAKFVPRTGTARAALERALPALAKRRGEADPVYIWARRHVADIHDDEYYGDRLIEELSAIEGDILIPFHPWYARLAGKRPFTHRMGVMDVSYVNPQRSKAPRCFWVGDKQKRNPPPWEIVGLRESISSRRWSAIVWDDRQIDHYFTGLSRMYRFDDDLPKDARPRVYTGNDVVPKQLWVPADPVAPPAGAHVLFNFEGGTPWKSWTPEGTAWGRRPVSKSVPGQKGKVRQYMGRYYATSMHGGDESTGKLTSPEFIVDGTRLTFRLSGGHDDERLRVELWVDGELKDFRTPATNTERMEEDGFHIAPYEGKRARIVLVDAAEGSWGHLNVDEFWWWD